jgi:hypothetical protein
MNSPLIAGTDQYPENGRQVVKSAIWQATKPIATYIMTPLMILSWVNPSLFQHGQLVPNFQINTQGIDQGIGTHVNRRYIKSMQILQVQTQSTMTSSDTKTHLLPLILSAVVCGVSAAISSAVI